MQIDASVLGVILAWFLIPLAILFATGILFSARSLLGFATGVFTFNYVIRVIAVLVNETFLVFAPKVQWRYGIGIYEKYVLTGDYFGLVFEPFGGQVLWNLPVWAFAGATRPSLLLSNAAAGALSASLAGLMVRSVTSRRTAVTVTIVFSMYLGALNFSMFGLRDPLLALASGILACTILRAVLGRFGIAELLSGIVGVCGTLWLRPEQFFIVLFVLGLPITMYYLGLFKRRRNKRRNFALAVFLLIPLVGIGSSMILVATMVAGKNIGISTVNPVKIAEENAEDRFSRHLDSDFGAGSNIVDAQTYQNMPAYIRIPVQIIGLVVLPFPWQIRGAEQLLAFVDSLFLIALLLASLRFVRRRDARDKSRRAVIALLATFTIGIAGMGFVVSNAGNGFRMRVAVVPFLMLAAGFAIGSGNRRESHEFLAEDDFEDGVLAEATNDPQDAFAALS